MRSEGSPAFQKLKDYLNFIQYTYFSIGYRINKVNTKNIKNQPEGQPRSSRLIFRIKILQDEKFSQTGSIFIYLHLIE